MVSQAASCIQCLVDVGVQGLAPSITDIPECCPSLRVPWEISPDLCCNCTTTQLTTLLNLASFIPSWLLSLKAVPHDPPARSPILGSVYQKIKSTAVIFRKSKTTFLLSLMVLVIFYFINSSSLLVAIRITRDTFISKVSQEVIFEDILRIFIVDAFNSMRGNSHKLVCLTTFLACYLECFDFYYVIVVNTYLATFKFFSTHQNRNDCVKQAFLTLADEGNFQNSLPHKTGHLKESVSESICCTFHL